MKKIWILFIALAAAAALTGSVYAASQIARRTAIGADAALNFACIDAGLLPEEVTDVEIEFEYEKGTFAYDIEFDADGVSYDYLVNSANGTILEASEEGTPSSRTEKADNQPDSQDNPTDPAKDSAENGQTPETGGAAGRGPSLRPDLTDPGLLSIDRAREIATTDAGYTMDEVTFSKAKLEEDDGQSYYEIKFYVTSSDTSGTAFEYEYKIDPYNGDILSRSGEFDDLDSEDVQSDNPDGKAVSKDNPDGKAVSKDNPDGKAVSKDNPDNKARQSGQKATTPDNGKKATTSDSNKKTTTPDSGKKTATPDSGKKTATPDSGKKTATPDNGRNNNDRDDDDDWDDDDRDDDDHDDHDDDRDDDDGRGSAEKSTGSSQKASTDSSKKASTGSSKKANTGNSSQAGSVKTQNNGSKSQNSQNVPKTYDRDDDDDDHDDDDDDDDD